ncbi:hypothetical protein MMC30_000486 [Trapelia coarctata]|nr:hypothetical protein [Trapelia coarctata]
MLARAQDQEGQGSWGFKISTDSEISVGHVKSQGLINYRWPCMSYELNAKILPNEQGQIEPGSQTDQPFGTLHTCTFVKDGTLFQVTVLRGTESKINTERRLRFNSGGMVRFGCNCSNNNREFMGRSLNDPLDPGEPSAVVKASASVSEQEPSNVPKELVYTLKSLRDGQVLSAVCESERYRDIHLDMQLFIDGQGIKMGDMTSTNQKYRHFVDISTKQERLLQHGSNLIVVGAFSLGVIGNPGCKYMGSCPSSKEIEDYLGIPSTSDSSTAKLWVPYQEDGIDLEGIAEVHMSARCVERILGVSSLPRVHSSPGELPKQHHEDQAIPLEPISIATPNSTDSTSPSSLANTEFPETPDNRLLPRKLLESSSSLEELLDFTAIREEEDRILNSLYPHKPRGELVFEGIAFIANIIGSQHVNWPSMFWQIRLLVKAFLYLTAMKLRKGDAIGRSTQVPNSKPDLPDEQSSDRTLHRIQRSYLLKIKIHIREALIWMLSSTEPSSEVPARPGCDSTFSGVVEMDYLSISIWYVLKYCPAALNRHFFAVLLQNLHKIETNHPFGGPPPDWGLSQYSSTKWQLVDALSWWCHFGCLHEIHKQLADRGYQTYSETTPIWSQVLQSQRKWRGVCEKMLKLLRKAQGDQRPQVDPAQAYTASDDEVLDRLVVLSAELKLDPPGPNLTESCLQQTRTKLKLRKHTTNFKPGFPQPGAPQAWAWKPEDSSPPWELECLNHHIRCMALPNLAEDDYSLEAKKHCFAFLHADYTFARSWNRSDSDMIRNWWDVEVSCVVCSTLLDERTSQNLYAGELGSSPTNANALTEFSRAATGQEDKLLKTMRDIRQLLQKDSQKVDTKLLFRWLEFQPPGYGDTFHPDWFLQSLDDTPELFTQEQIGKVKLRSDVKDYLEARAGDGQSQQVSGLILHKNVDAVDTLFLSVFDISQTAGLEFETSTSICRNGSFAHLLDDPLAGADPMVRKLLVMNKGKDPSDGTAAERLWLAHLGHRLEDSDPFKALSPEDQQIFKKSTFPENWYRGRLLDHLSDSLVDQKVKYRLLFSQMLSQSLAKAFIYIWHPQALDALNSYLGSRNLFVNTEGTDFSQWTTSITVVGWGLRPPSFPEDLVRRFEEGRKHGEIPPKKLLDLVGADKKGRWTRTAQNTSGTEESMHRQLEEQASTIVISGDPHGIFWKCSILSPLFRDEPDASKDDSEPSTTAYVREVEEIAQMFVHRQAVGRRLCFVMLVGHLCHLLAEEYENIVTYLDTVLDISKEVLFDGLDMGKSAKALGKLERLIWGLESFRIFDNALSSSVNEIKQVAPNFQEFTKEEREQWNPKLAKECDRIIDEYSKRSEKLSGVLSEIKYKVEQITRLRDGISSFTNVEQSLESLEQNSNIRILTFITIAYLPLGFVAALFSIGYGILPESAGRGLFIGLIILFFSATILMGTVIEKLTNLWEDFKEFRKEKAEEARRVREEAEGERPKEQAAWKDFWEKVKVNSRGGGEEKKVEESKEEHAAWKDRFRVRRRRGGRGGDVLPDVEVGVNGNGSEGTDGAKES